jgi:hypothetical protein
MTLDLAQLIPAHGYWVAFVGPCSKAKRSLRWRALRRIAAISRCPR